MEEYEDGSVVYKDVSNLKILVKDQENGNLEISGFKDIQEMSVFENFGDFEEGENNDFFVCTGSKAKLKWKYL